MADQDDDLPGEAIASDSDGDRHNDGANYLLLRGRAKCFTESSAAYGRPDSGLRPTLGYDELRRLRGDERLPEPEFPAPERSA